VWPHGVDRSALPPDGRKKILRCASRQCVGSRSPRRKSSPRQNRRRPGDIAVYYHYPHNPRGGPDSAPLPQCSPRAARRPPLSTAPAVRGAHRHPWPHLRTNGGPGGPNFPEQPQHLADCGAIAVQIRVHQATRHVFVQIAQILRQRTALLDVQAATHARQQMIELCRRADLRAVSRLSMHARTVVRRPKTASNSVRTRMCGSASTTAPWRVIRMIA
jgi:hypothetical protein